MYSSAFEQFGLVYFAFVDGALAYDCVECGAACCRGKGFYLSPDELARLQRRYPDLAQFAAAPPSAVRSTLVVVEPPPRCFFLDDGGRCDVERELGHRSKPTGCRLFPFNRFLALGDVLCVMSAEPCPIELWAPDASGLRVRHDDLTGELASVEDLSLFTSSRPPVAVHDGFRDGIGAERAARDETIPFLASGDLAGFLATFGIEIERELSELERFLGIAPAARPSAATGRALIASAPQIRLELIASGRFAWHEIAPVAARCMTALALFAALHERLARSVVSPATMLRLSRELAPLLLNLARLSSKPRIRPGTRMTVSPQIRPQVEQLVSCLATDRMTLRSVVEQVEPVAARRAGFLRSLGDLSGALQMV